MSKCDDLFQKRQSLLAEQKKNNEDIARLNTIRASVDFPEESRWQDIRDKLAKYMEDQKAAKRIREAMDDPKKKGYSSIPTDQPLNFVQKMRDYPDEMVVDIANVSQAFLRAGKEGTPEQYAFLKADPYEAAKHISSTMNTARTPTEILNIISNLQAVPNSTQDLLEKTLRARWLNETGLKEFIRSTEEIQKFMIENPNKEVPIEQLARLFDVEKIAFWSQSKYDFYRNQWHKQGKAMQGDMFSDDVLKLMDDAKDINPDNYSDPVSYANSFGTLDKKIEDVNPENDLTGRIWQAAADNVTRPKEAVEQLALEINNIKIRGVDPQKRRPIGAKEIRNKKLRLTNELAKDLQLFNLRTLGLAVQSNTVMAIYGPYHTFLRNAIYKPYGTSFQEGIFNALEDNWKGLRQGIEAVRQSAKATMIDAGNLKPSFFASNVDSYGKFDDSAQQRLDDIKFLLSPDKPSRRIEQVGWALNPERMFRYTQAAFRLFIYKKTGSSMALKPGYTSLGAIDGPGGLFYTNFKLRTEYQQKARREGVQRELGELLGRKPNQRDLDNWVNERMEEAFYKEDPTEAQIKAYRKEQNIPEGVMSDDAVADEILETRVRETYGGPVPLDDDVVKEASDFSEMMRFQNKPKDGSWLKKPYNLITEGKRKNPYVDTGIPYLTSAYSGMNLDGRISGFAALNDLVKGRLGKMTDKQRAGTMADMLISLQFYGLWNYLNSQGAIIGNGPLDQEQRKMWRDELEAKGQVPNSIYGIPLVGGIPIANLMMLMSDVHLSMQDRSVNKNIMVRLGESFFTGLMGHLQRNTSLGQLGQLMDVITNEDYNFSNPTSKALALAGYVGGSRLPTSGSFRTGERIADSSKYQYFVNAKMEDWESELFNEEETSKAIQYLKDFVEASRTAGMSITGLTGMLPGGRKKDKDWLGSKISYPWGTKVADFIMNGFEPVLHPNDKVYAELRLLGLLIPPSPLVEKRLGEVPMTDDMQWLYNEIYGSVGPGLEPSKRAKTRPVYGLPSEVIPKETYSYDKRDVSDLNFDFNEGVYKKEFEEDEFSTLNINEILDEHVYDTETGEGRTFIEAARSLINSPRYQLHQNNPRLSTDPNINEKPRHVRDEKYAMKAMKTLRKYYATLALRSFRLSKDKGAEQYDTFMKNLQNTTNFENEKDREAGEQTEELVRQS